MLNEVVALDPTRLVIAAVIGLIILLVLIILDVPHMLLTRPLYAIVNFITTTIFHIF